MFLKKQEKGENQERTIKNYLFIALIKIFLISVRAAYTIAGAEARLLPKGERSRSRPKAR